MVKLFGFIVHRVTCLLTLCHMQLNLP
jgi:hypothetical protein